MQNADYGVLMYVFRKFVLCGSYECLALTIRSFVSNLLVEIISKTSDRLIYIIPIIMESNILSLIASFGLLLISKNPDILACSLLFSMWLQNSLVTTISNATVRTTHLTGLFKDLGIEISQLSFYKQEDQKDKLHSSIKLRVKIIAIFIIGGL